MSQVLITELFEWAQRQCDPEFLPETRLHKTPNLIPDLKSAVFIKREDEAGYMLPGGKKRKLASLLPFLKNGNFNPILLAGGSLSNNIIATASVLRENGFQLHFLLKESGNIPLAGNLLLRKLLIPETEITYIPSGNWPRIQQIAEAKLQTFLDAGQYPFFIPEGAKIPEALPGSLLLMQDILRNQEIAGIKFDRIFIDAGTGMTAIGLCAAASFLPSPPEIHIIRMAGTREEFHSDLASFLRGLHQSLGIDLPEKPSMFPFIHFPASARSFGSVNATILQEIVALAREQGVLTDPIYSAKFFLTVKKLLKEDDRGDQVLLIHSGGVNALPGFTEKLEAFI